MFERFSGHLRTTVAGARSIARLQGSPTIEAQHLLLAILDDPSARTARAIRRLGLSKEAVGDAIDRELAGALGAVGVSLESFASTRRVPGSSNPRWGQSAKLALERTLRAASDRGDKRLDDRHLLLGLARAEAGVVPRLFELLGLTPGSVAAALA